MSERGVFAVDRGIWSDPDFPNEPYSEREAFLWLVSEAAWRPTKVRVGSRVIELERGQCSFSTRFMATKFQWSEARVRRFLQRRSDLKQLCTKIDAGATQVTICKYDAFQRVGLPSDAPATQERRTSDAKKKQGNKETDISEANASSISEARDYEQEAYVAFNETARRASLPVAEKLTKDRRAKIKARLSEANGLDGWHAAMARLEASDFCAGRSTSFRATIDFVLQPSSFRKLMEGAYDNNPNQRGQHEQHRTHSARPTFSEQAREGVRRAYADRGIREPVEAGDQGRGSDWPGDEHSGRMASRTFSFERGAGGTFEDPEGHRPRYANARH